MRRTQLLGTMFALIAGLAMTGTILSQQYTESSSTITVSVSEPEIADPPLDIGKNFTADITVKSVNNLYTWQAGMIFNANVLEVLSFTEGSFLKHGGSTLWVNGTIDNTNGIIVYHASTLVGNVTGAGGNGALGTIPFKVKQYGNSTLHLANVILLDSTLSEYTEVTLKDYTVIIKIPGDINGDNIVHILDLNPLGKAYGSTPGTPNWNPDADINQDNIVDDADLAFLSENYGKTT